MSESTILPASGSTRYQSLDFWRGVACLMIVVVHSSQFRLDEFPTDTTINWKFLAGQVGWHGMILDKITSRFGVGVPIFFVISGYCIAASCDSARRKPRAMGTFYLRRFRRIFPPCWIYYGLIALLFASLSLLRLPDSTITDLSSRGVSLNNPLNLGFWEFTGSFFLTGTWQDRIVGHGGRGISGQTWSLCYEEQFYFISGLLLWLVPNRFFWGITAITAAVLALFLAAPSMGLDLHGFFFDGFWLLFAAGMLVYYRCNYLSGRSALTADLVLLIAFVAFCVGRPESKWFDVLFFPTGFGFALLLCRLHRWDSKLATMALLIPIAFCGRMCYSLYLIHYPVAAIVSKGLHEVGVRGFWQTMLVVVPVCMGLSIACAHVFSVLVERRFLNTSSAPLKRNADDRVPTPAPEPLAATQ
jgi:peptidoglycan/LPS O-acetylase OafA/YrhL